MKDFIREHKQTGIMSLFFAVPALALMVDSIFTDNLPKFFFGLGILLLAALHFAFSAPDCIVEIEDEEEA